MLWKIILIILIILLFFVVILPVILQIAGVNVLGLEIFGGESGRGRGALFLRSSDGGVTWKETEFRREGGESLPSEITGIAFHPANPDILFSGTRSAGLWTSQDGGITWAFMPGLSRGLSGKIDVFAVSVPRVDSQVIYAAVFAERRGRVLKSTDGGESFSEVYRVTGEGFGVFDVYAAPQDAEQVIIATGEGGVLESRDGGKTWRVLRWFGETLANIFVNPFSSAEMYVLTSRGKVFKTSDGGVNWIDISRNIQRAGGKRPSGTFFGGGRTAVETTAFAPNPGFFNIVHAGAGTEFIRSTNGGAAWGKIELPAPPSAGTIDAIAVHPRDPHGLWVALGSKLYRSADGGIRWGAETLPAAGRAVGLFVHPQNPEIIFAAIIR